MTKGRRMNGKPHEQKPPHSEQGNTAADEAKVLSAKFRPCSSTETLEHGVILAVGELYAVKQSQQLLTVICLSL